MGCFKKKWVDSMRVKGKRLLKQCTFFNMIRQYRDLQLDDIVNIDWSNDYIVKSISNINNETKYSLINIKEGKKIYLIVSKEYLDIQYVKFTGLKHTITVRNDYIFIDNKRLSKNSDYYIKYMNKYRVSNLFDIVKLTKDEIEEI